MRFGKLKELFKKKENKEEKSGLLEKISNVKNKLIDKVSMFYYEVKNDLIRPMVRNLRRVTYIFNIKRRIENKRNYGREKAREEFFKKYCENSRDRNQTEKDNKKLADFHELAKISCDNGDKIVKNDDSLHQRAMINGNLFNEQRIDVNRRNQELARIMPFQVESNNGLDYVSDINEELEETVENKSLGMYMMNDNDDLSYILSYKFIRKDGYEDFRSEAYAKLANAFGTNNREKEKETEISKLSNYSRRLKALSEYGKKVNGGYASKEETELYFALLYNLGKDMDEEDVMDYLSDAYEEEQKVYRKAS